MSDALYRIEDEPRPGALAHLVVSPMPILLAAMLGGPWLAWPWFVLNGIALGSPTLRRELAVVAVGVAGAAAITAATVTLIGGGVVEDATRIRLLLLVLIGWKLGLSYVLYHLQARGFAIYQYFGRPVRNGFLFAIVAGIFGRRMLVDMPEGLLKWVLL